MLTPATLTRTVAGALEEALEEALREALLALDIRDSRPEMLAESVRQAALSLERLVGRVGAENYLDVVFASFCIGK